MADEQQVLFNFYRRYKWTAQDFEDWQNGLIGVTRSAFEAVYNGAVMGGFDVAPVSGMLLEVSSGIAMGPSGYVMVENDINQVSFSAPGSNVRKDLIVARPLLVDDTPITRPTNPFDTVYLKQLQDTEIVVIAGTAGVRPSYPSVQDGDIIIAGVRIAAGQSSLVQDDIDFEVRDHIGKNSLIQDNFARYDKRMLPYRSDRKTVGIMPSQLEHPGPRGFTFIGQGPSLFPKTSGGLFNNLDALVDMEAGTVGGGDEQSPSFTPTIPTAGKYVVATIGVDANDLLRVAFGTEGTHTQCVEGVQNQVPSGAGSVTYVPGTKLIAFVIAYSNGGVTIDDLEVLDGRSWGSSVGAANSSNPGVAGGTVVELDQSDFPYTVTLAHNGNVFLVDSTSGPSGGINFLLPTPTANFKLSVRDKAGTFGASPCRFVRFGSERFEGELSDYLMQAASGTWTPFSEGSNWYLL